MKSFTNSIVLAITLLVFTTNAFAQNKSIELNNGVLNELMQAGGWDVTQTAWSAELWIKFRTVLETDESHYLHVWKGQTDLGSQFYCKQAQVLSTAGNQYSFGQSGETDITLDVWHHIAITVDGDADEFFLYLNGEEEMAGLASGNVEGVAPTMLDSIVIGHFRGLYYDADWAATCAKFDEVRIWYKALTQAEVQANMNKELTSGDGLEAVWNFNDPADINKDATGNGHTLYSAGRVDTSNLSDDVPIIVGVEQNPKDIIPEMFELSQNYPNPFNPSTVIDFALVKESNVKLDVFNVIGEKVAELVNSNLSAGSYSVTFDAADLTSGIYFYKISTGDFVSIKKMMLLK